MSGSSVELTRVIENITVERQGRVICSRDYHIYNNSDSEADLRSIPFTAKLPPRALNCSLHERSYGTTILVHTRTIDWGKEEAKWSLQKPTLSSHERYEFTLQWELPHLIQVTRDFQYFFYEFGTEQLVHYELIIRLPQKRDILIYSNNNQNYILEFLKHIFSPIHYSADLFLEREDRQGYIYLKYITNVSLNHPLKISVFYWVELPWWVIYGFGVLTGLALELIGSFLYDLIKSWWLSD